LDVGCFRGDFLKSLAPGYELYGIEPNRSAAVVAESRGVRIIGNVANDDFEAPPGGFGTIVLMDVAEHVEDPCSILKHLSHHLAPGGIVVVVSGNAAHWLARLSLPFYWYMSFPFHLAYLSKPYMDYVATTAGLKWIAWRTLAHHSFRPHRVALQYVQGVYVAINRRSEKVRRICRSLSEMGLSALYLDEAEPPRLFGIRDHFWAVLQARRANA
jgi:SAM-dependent methyltransferase